MGLYKIEDPDDYQHRSIYCWVQNYFPLFCEFTLPCPLSVFYYQHRLGYTEIFKCAQDLDTRFPFKKLMGI